jgi:hypothetical protein
MKLGDSGKNGLGAPWDTSKSNELVYVDQFSVPKSDFVTDYQSSKDCPPGFCKALNNNTVCFIQM